MIVFIFIACKWETTNEPTETIFENNEQHTPKNEAEEVEVDVSWSEENWMILLHIFHVIFMFVHLLNS